jgi:hypothetical protein
MSHNMRGHKFILRSFYDFLSSSIWGILKPTHQFVNPRQYAKCFNFFMKHICETVLGNSFTKISITKGSATPKVTAFFVFCCKMSIYNPVGAFLRVFGLNFNRSETRCPIHKLINSQL